MCGFKRDTVRLNSITNNTIKCSCGHSMLTTQSKVLCTWCGNYVYKDKKEEFKERLKESLKMRAKSQDLTFMQKVVLEEIKKYCQEKLQSPTLNELCERVGINTRSTMYEHLKELEKKGYIIREPKKKRGIKITEKGEKKELWN